MIGTIIWQSVKFDPSKIVRQTAAAIGDEFKIFDIDARNKTIRERYCNADDLPSEVVTQCRARSGLCFRQVDLPPEWRA